MKIKKLLNGLLLSAFIIAMSIMTYKIMVEIFIMYTGGNK